MSTPAEQLVAEDEAPDAAPPQRESAVGAARRRLGDLVESVAVRNTVTALILLNAAVLGVQTSQGAKESFGGVLTALDKAILAVFVVEIAVKLVAFGPRFFRSGWNVFDFLIVGVALVPTSGPMQILRALRILRVLRLLSTVGRLRVLVESLVRAIPGMGWAAAMLAMVFYIFGVMGTELFGEKFPDWFGTLGRSMYSMFQIMTLESWSMGIARPVMEEYPAAWLFFVPFILIASFMVLNLFIAIIVNATQDVHEEDVRAEREVGERAAAAERKEMLDLLRDLNAKVAALESRVKRDDT